MPDDSIPGPTPTGYQRTQGGGFKWVPPTPEKLAQMLPQYEIEALVGRGGMGAVYKGKQKTLDRPVAIKILPPEVDEEDGSYTQRFKNEAKIMAKLEHPAIVPVYDFGETPEGQLYFVMSFINGTDVHQLIQQQGRLPPEHALAITAHVCDALRYAHEHGVVHRDIKPSNVLINMEGQVKVADFGLAKVDDPSQSSGLTKTGLAMGTPDYVAPETLMMGVNVDGRADLYAVGVMLYQMLTGNVPRGAFKPASVMIPGIDPRFDVIATKAMQHDREERYQTAAEIRRDLDVILTMPMVQHGGKASAAIPQQSLPQKPVAKGPQKPMGKSANVPVRKEAAAPAPNPQSEIAPPKSKAPLLIGIGAAAAIAVGAVFLRSSRREEAPDATARVSSSQTANGSAGNSSLVTSASTGTSAAPIKVREDPKPMSSAAAPVSIPKSTISNPTAAPAAFPPGKWVKVFTKLEDLPDDLRKPDSGVKFEDGWIRTLSSDRKPIYLPGGLGTNCAIRAKFILGERSEGHRGIALRSNTNPKRFCSLMVTPMRGLVCNKFEGAEPAVIFSESITVPQPGDVYTMEFAAIGEKFIGRYGTSVVRMAKDDSIMTGRSYLSGNDPMGDIEVINLDGIPEAEALKILGVDEKGNDLRQPAVIAASSSSVSSSPPLPVSKSSTTPSLPVSQSSAKFPPGQWVKVFTKFEDLPEEMRKPDSGVKFEDGWLINESGSRYPMHLPDMLGNDCAIRLRTRRAAGKNVFRSIALRVGRSIYALQLDADLACLHVNGTQGRVISKLTVPVPKVGSEYTLEFAVIGDRLFGRYNSNLLIKATDSALPTGKAYTSGIEPVRDIEVINLDGIPEAEALRILGVDEKGNDLRALAAKQEQQKAEQAKAVDAIATIPELKTLHEQFVKLQAERVTAPFAADMAKLNTGYLGGLDREIEKEKKAGHLDGVIVLEAEKKLVAVAGVSDPGTPGSMSRATTMPIPAEDDDATPANLKGLRKIYRDAFAKLEATRAANLKLLTDPLSIRLKQLESTLTQKNRIDHAKTVREYREALGRADGPPSAAATPQPTLGGPSPLPAAVKDGITNTLGMKFLPVKGTDVLFCIHEVRYSDYAAYATEAQGVDGSWKDQSVDGFTPTVNKEDHPVMKVSWDEAQKFCEWLSKKEGKKYRLPTDEEWSIAVGLGRAEKRPKGTTPAMLSGKESTEFPWGGDFPPKTKDKAGNYSDASRKAKAPNGDAQYLEDYDDGFPTTAPVMSFKPNKFGLYDMGGNVLEWCEDWFDNAQKDRVLRSGSYDRSDRANLLSSFRHHITSGNRSSNFGFRCVLVVSGG